MIPILLYHKLGSPPRGCLDPNDYISGLRFTEHLDHLLAEGYTCISVSAIGCNTQPLPERPVVLTFDDGFACLHESALPALAARSMVATVFLPTAGVDGQNIWGQRPWDPREAMLNWSQVREMREAGIEFGSHALTHPDLTCLSPEDARRQITESRLRIEEMLGEECVCFAYPYGAWGEREKTMVREAGYQRAVSTRRMKARPECDPLALPRLAVRRYDLVPPTATSPVIYLAGPRPKRPSEAKVSGV